MSDGIGKAVEALAQLNTLAEATAGYHRTLKDAGIPEPAIIHCVSEYHTFLIALLRKSMLGEPAPRSLLQQVNEAAEKMRREGRLP